MDISAYLQRIGYEGDRAPTMSVLRDVHRCHVLTIPYENLDVVKQIPVDQEPAHLFDKMVTRGRGGWCYEMNGLLGWALKELGFDVTHQIGGVMRERMGDAAFGNHLVLRVNIDDAHVLADAGLGDGPVAPLLLQAGSQKQGHRAFRLEDVEPGIMRVHNHDGAMPPSFDFRYHPEHGGFLAPYADEATLSETCTALQVDEQSMFRQNLICQQVRDDGISSLVGQVLTVDGERTLLNSAGELETALEQHFGLYQSVADIWDHVVARHGMLFGDAAADEIKLGPPPSD